MTIIHDKGAVYFIKIDYGTRKVRTIWLAWHGVGVISLAMNKDARTHCISWWYGGKLRLPRYASHQGARYGR